MSNHPKDNIPAVENNSSARDKAAATDTPFTGTPAAFKERCATFLVVLCNDKNMEKAAHYLSPDCVLIHEDHPPVKGPKEFIEVWQKNLAGMPDYHKDSRDMVVEMEAGDQGVARVWVYSQITGIVPGATTDSIDMMRFTVDGLFLASKGRAADHQKILTANFPPGVTGRPLESCLVSSLHACKSGNSSSGGSLKPGSGISWVCPAITTWSLCSNSKQPVTRGGSETAMS